MRHYFIHGDERPPETAPVYVLGMFDGVHKGHVALIERARAEAHGGCVGAYTLDTHPLELLDPSRTPPSITLLRDKLDLLGQAGADVVIVQRFDADFAAMSPERFVDHILAGALAARHVVAGFNYSFGSCGSGSAADLLSLCERRGIEVTVVPPVEEDGAPVASTAIRAALAGGDVLRAARLLGRRHFLRGRVERGRGVGRLLSIPTANIALADGVAIPKDGVYAVEAVWGGGNRAPGVCNIGVRPTFHDESRGKTMEVHLIGVDEDLYGVEIVVEFAMRLRDEMVFATPGDLAAQIELDMSRTLAALGREGAALRSS